MEAIFYEIILTFIIFIIGICHGIAGFGFGLLSIPILTYFYDIKHSIIIATYLTFISYLFIIFRSYKSIKIKKNLLTCIFIFIGMAIGIYIFKTIDEKPLKIITGLTIAIFGILLAGNYFPILGTSPYVKALFGLSSGTLMTTCGMGGNCWMQMTAAFL